MTVAGSIGQWCNDQGSESGYARWGLNYLGNMHQSPSKIMVGQNNIVENKGTVFVFVGVQPHLQIGFVETTPHSGVTFVGTETLPHLAFAARYSFRGILSHEYALHEDTARGTQEDWATKSAWPRANTAWDPIESLNSEFDDYMAQTLMSWNPDRLYVPKTYSEAMKLNSEHWTTAMDVEMALHEKKGTWELQQPPSDPCVRVKISDDGAYTLTDTYTDDVWGTSSSVEEGEKRKAELAAMWDIKDVGNTHRLLACVFREGP
ncbi:hypothetical protein B0H19DRAFT_1058230 [Mycena capillaripes]|nr:hypothetical protein B0H19DRAFT_1058230 [Mycena capillaripes]